jgi:hypothetical protein
MRDRLLGIYLNDHLAGEVAGRELAQRCRDSNSDTDLGRYLDQFLAELKQDRAQLEAIMDRLGVRRDTVKQGAAWIAEKVARLKLNGYLRGYSPLSRLVETETLCLGIEGKLALWRTLMRISTGEPRLASFDLAELERRASRQRAFMEEFRLEAAARAFED